MKSKVKIKNETLRKRLWKAQGGLCFYCDKPMLLNAGYMWHGLLPSKEHLKPRSEGGTHNADNIVLAHRKCNSLRGSRPLTAQEVLKADAIIAKAKTLGDSP